MSNVKSVNLIPKTLILEKGKTFAGIYTSVIPVDVGNVEFEFTSKNSSVANVASDGVSIKAIDTGNTTITATEQKTGKKSTMNVIVCMPGAYAKLVSGIVFNKTYMPMTVGNVQTLSTAVAPADASYKRLSWYSTNEEVATVNSNGTVTAIGRGNATIMACADDGSGVYACCGVTVSGNTPVKLIELSDSNANLTVGGSMFLKAEILPTNATNKCLEWTSSNPEVASVNPNSGLVYAKSAGTTTISATACDGSGVCSCCTVQVFSVCVENIVICPTSLTMQIGEKSCLEVNICPTNATNQNIAWSSFDPNIADVDCNGCVTAKSAGTTYIYATALDGSEKAGQCWITVEPKIKDNVEYHLICNGDSTKALRVGTANLLELNSERPVRGDRKSYWMRQKWKIQSIGSAKKLFTQLDNSYYLCNNGSNDGYVSNNASDNDSNIVITHCADSTDLYEIKLANSDLYLTLEYSSSDQCYWAKWRPKSASSTSSRVWKFVEQPANLHNGVDTGSILNETTIQALKSDNTEFVIRYYKLLDTLLGVELLTKGSTSYNGQTMSKIDATILKLQEKGINLDVENYLEYADTIPLNDNNLYITGNGKSLVTYEKDLYKKHNINIVSVYQNDGTQYEYFTENHAKLDALSALMSAKILNQPHGTAIYFAVDYVADNNQLERIKNYFNIIKNKLGGRYKIGVYGTGLVCSAVKPESAYFSWLSQSTGSEGTENYEHYEDYDDTTKYNIKQAEYCSYNDIKFDDDIAVGSNYGQWYM